MSDFIKNLKGLFVTDQSSEETPTPDDKVKLEEAVEQAIPKVTEYSMDENVDDSTDLKGKISPKFTKILLEAIERHNMSGFDYLEYKNGILSLAKMDMDEATKYKSAFAMAETMGAKSSMLIESANHYLTVLVEEKKKFDNAAQAQIRSKVEDRKKEIALSEKLILQKQSQIDKLQKELQVLREKIDKASHSLDSEELKVQKTQAHFVASYNNLYNQIKADVDKMTNYLK